MSKLSNELHFTGTTGNELCTCLERIKDNGTCLIHGVGYEHEHDLELLREAQKEMISDEPDESVLWEEEEYERDRQDENNFKRGVDY